MKWGGHWTWDNDSEMDDDPEESGQKWARDKRFDDNDMTVRLCEHGRQL